MDLTRRLIDQVARRGFVVRRHPMVRIAAQLAEHGVDVVLDVGAAVGEYGRELRHFGYAGRIVSFEPMAASYQALTAAAAGDATWETRRCALGRQPGTAQINVASNSDSSSMLPMADAHRAAAPHVDYVDTERIDVVRLDDLDPVPAGGTGFLKIDTQGYERDVLAGGARTVDRCAGVQLELSFVPLYDGGPLIDELVADLYGRGFHLTGIEPGFAAPGGAVLQADGVFFRG